MNKQITVEEVVAQLGDGMTIGIGGWGPRRKPMSLVREVLRSPLKDLTLVGYGGPDMGMLCAAGKVRKLIYGFVSLDFVPLEPFFRKAREAGTVEAMYVTPSEPGRRGADYVWVRYAEGPQQGLNDRVRYTEVEQLHQL